MSCDASSRWPCDPTYPSCRTMSLRQFSLNRQVVLRGVLRPHLRLEIAVEQHRSEAGPIRVGVPGGGLRMPVKGLGLHRSAACATNGVLRKVEGRIRAATERWFSAELFEHQLLHRVVEHAPPGANAGLAVSRKACPRRCDSGCRQFRCEARTPCSRSESSRLEHPDRRAPQGQWVPRRRWHSR